MLVVIPFLATIFGIVLSSFAPILLSQQAEGIQYAFSHIYLVSIVGLVYAFYLVRLRNIEIRGFSNLLMEQAYVKKILYFETPVLILSTFITLIIGYFEYDPLLSPTNDFLNTIGEPFGGFSIMIRDVSEEKPVEISGRFFGPYFFSGLMINLGFSVTAGIIWLILVAARRELAYYLAKSLFQTATQEREASKKAGYLIKATKMYDKYLRRTLNLEINDAKKIYSKILSDPNLNKNESMRLISESFESNDKLEPINVLSKIAYVEDDNDTFLVDESIGKKIKDMAIFFATIIPVVITVIQLMLQRG